MAIERYSAQELTILGKILKEALRENPVNGRCERVTFISRSAGRGRERKEREVDLLVIDKKYAFQIIRGEVHSRRKRNFVPIDAAALELLKHLPEEERTPEALLRIAKPR